MLKYGKVKGRSYWSNKQLALLFSMAKNNTPMPEVEESLPTFSLRKIKEKARIMGFSYADGILHIKR